MLNQGHLQCYDVVGWKRGRVWSVHVERVGKVRPAGQIWPAGQIRPASSVHPARSGSSVLTLNVCG